MKKSFIPVIILGTAALILGVVSFIRKPENRAINILVTLGTLSSLTGIVALSLKDTP